MKLFVGNLAFDVTDDDLRQVFEQHGQVESASIVKDRFSNESRGFGFVEMPNQSEAEAAAQALNGQEYAGRNMTVNEARPMPERGPRGGGGFGGGGGRGGFGGNRKGRFGSGHKKKGGKSRFGKRPY